MSFAAKWAGKCAECGESFAPGAEIEYEEDSVVLVHKHGAESELLNMIGSKPVDVCHRCFLVHAGECL